MRKPSAGMVVAVLALVFALAGSAIAASGYIITSTGQIKPSVVKKLKGKKGKRGKTGAKGPQGPRGPQGPAGPSALTGISTVNGPVVTMDPFTVESSLALCPGGSRVVSGGGSSATDTGLGLAVSQATGDRGGWFVIGVNDAATTGEIQAVAYCAGTGRAVASSRKTRQRALREVEAWEAKLRR